MDLRVCSLFFSPRCKKGFPVSFIEYIHHEGVISKRLVILSSYESIESCSESVDIGIKLDWKQKVHILGRPYTAGRSLSRQHVALAGKDYRSTSINKHLKSNSTICVKDVARCPVRAGDLMMQNGHLFGLASTSVQRFRVACFGDLNIVKDEFKMIDPDIKFSDFTEITRPVVMDKYMYYTRPRAKTDRVFSD